jgi:hypothetical protein
MDESAGFYVNDSALKRHWCPLSQEYAGGDALLTALDRGWQIVGVVFCQEVWHGGSRRIRVYHIDLTRDLTTVRMRVLSNPFVERLLSEESVRVVLMNQRKDTALERW